MNAVAVIVTQFTEQVRKLLWTRNGVRATVVTAGHCTLAELTSGHALASCYIALEVIFNEMRYTSPRIVLQQPAGRCAGRWVTRTALALY